MIDCNLVFRNLSSVDSSLAATSIKDITIEATIFGISYQLRDIYSIYKCRWNYATYKWKVHSEKIEIILFIVKFRSLASLKITIHIFVTVYNIS